VGKPSARANNMFICDSGEGFIK